MLLYLKRNDMIRTTIDLAMYHLIAILLVASSGISLGDYLQCPTGAFETYLSSAGLTSVLNVVNGIPMYGSYSASGPGVNVYYSKVSISGSDIISGYLQWNVGGGSAYSVVGIQCGCGFATLNEPDFKAYVSGITPSGSSISSTATYAASRWDYALTQASQGSCQCLGLGADCDD
jgi:hypothetical protein